jgi:hypothetical protein
MTTSQGDLSLLNDPVAEELLKSALPAHLAYTWTDGTPRLVPIWFHWNGREIVLTTPVEAPKMKALKNGTKVAVTIDSDTMPYKVLMVRGTVRTDTVEGIAPEYEAAARRVLGEEGGLAWLDQASGLMPRASRVFVSPEWVGILDFEARFPSALERAMDRVQATA